MGINEFGKIIFIAGIIFIVIGGIFMLSGKFPFIGRLPGDIFIRKDGFTLYIPIVTSIIISIILTILINIFFRK